MPDDAPEVYVSPMSSHYGDKINQSYIDRKDASSSGKKNQKQIMSQRATLKFSKYSPEKKEVLRIQKSDFP